MPGNNAIDGGSFDDDSDVVSSLLNTLFKIKPDSEKCQILQSGRPTPKLSITKKDLVKNCTRTFQDSWYEVHKWMCGSSTHNKLFCWPCLLMRPDSSTWCSTGVDDVKRLSSMATKHATCKSHSKSIAEYDATLIGFGLLPEFMNEGVSCKEEGNHLSESDEDYFEQYFSDEPRSKKIKKEMEKEAKKRDEKGQISFKDWQEMNKGCGMHHDRRLCRRKRKIAKQELMNAKLIGKKTWLEIKLLKEKLEMQRALNKEAEGSETPSLELERSEVVKPQGDYPMQLTTHHQN